MQKKDLDTLIINVSGVGYVVSATEELLHNFNKGDEIELTIHTIVKEDSITLYGFANEEQRFWFLRLLNIQGVGAKMALAILNILSPNEIIHAVSQKEEDAFKRVSGVGPKLAKRLVNEINIKALKIDPSSINKPNSAVSHKAKEEAQNALISLGFQKNDVLKVLETVNDNNLSLEDIIKYGLSKLTSH